MPVRLMHTMLRVMDLQRSLDFYVGRLGMRLLRSTDYPNGRFTNTFVGFEDEERGTVLELTHNWDRTEPYEHGTAWGHLAFGVSSLRECVERLRAAGVPVVREPGPMSGGTREIAFVLDPDGYRVELLESVVEDA
ncbi:lactoylglutathione lyase [Pseudomonas sp. ATCC 13867]|uniref:lactoylglutathione lyase n=1 Tax=Pseudomonas sp. ATCC 13867 TaxID=1294143 RepID=UPI0002C4ED67|nr:lactoylglutathione lyase [Pseudomonas sp. ATCC 13867]